MLITWGLAMITHEEEWNAGVVLATLAFTIVFVILSILAVSIKITSKALTLRVRRRARGAVRKEGPQAVKREEKVLSLEDLAETAAAVVAMHKTLELAAGTAAVHHHVLTTRKVIAPYIYPQAPPIIKPWVIAWLNEATYKLEINPYVKGAGWNARNL